MRNNEEICFYKMLGFPQKLCLIFAIVLSTDVEFIMGRPVNNAKLNSLLEVGCISVKESCDQLLRSVGHVLVIIWALTLKNCFQESIKIF